jgi:DNA-binding CsgD family transcriptional regulator
MRFREATVADIPALVPLFDGGNTLPLAPAVRTALPALLGRLLASPASTLTVFEEEDRHGLRPVSFVGGLFLREEVIADYEAAPFPGLLAGVFAGLLRGQQPLLTLEEIRRANSGAGLSLGVIPIALAHLDWHDPTVEQYRKLAPQAFIRAIGGYRIRAIYYEVFSDEVATYVQSGGYRLLHDFSTHAGTGHIRRDCRPRMLRLRAEDLPPGAMSLASQLFDPPVARLGLTPAEQRIVLRSLDGASDRAIAESLGHSVDTVRSNWRSVYRRMAHLLPDTAPAHAADAARGLEKRRVIIEYLRQNLHELRPVRPAPRSANGR